MRKYLFLMLSFSITALLLTPCLAACPAGSFEIGKKVRIEGGKKITERQCMPVSYAKNWDREQQRIIEGDLTSIPDESFKRWVNGNVVFERISRGMLDSPVTASPGVIRVYDPYVTLKDARRKDLLVFELGKVLWFERINPGPREAQTKRTREFEALYQRHERTIYAMQLSLGLVDNDPQSQFAYACRVEVLNQEPPEKPPGNYSNKEWADIQSDWVQTRNEVRGFLGELFDGN